MKETIARSTLALCLGLAALPGVAQESLTVRVDVAQANFRAGCSEDADVIADLERGEELRLLASEGSWYRVLHVESGIEGCMHRGVLEVETASEEIAEEEGSAVETSAVFEDASAPEPAGTTDAEPDTRSTDYEPPPPPASTAPTVTRDRIHWDLGPRVLGFRETGDSYEFVYGSDLVFQYGVRLEMHAGSFLLALEGETGEADGELVLPIDPPIGQGQEPTLTLTPIHLTGAWAFRPDRALHGYVGGGATYMSWEEELGNQSNSGNEIGYHIAAGLRWSFADHRVTLAADLISLIIPDAIGEGGTSQLVGETDIEGAGIGLGLLFRLR